MVQKHYANNYISNKFLLSILISFSLIKSVTSQCNSLNCPPLRGLCSNNICVCEEGFTTVNNKYIKTNGIFCNYILKSRYIAFILEFFFPFGAGHFYSGKTIFASIKLGIFVAIIISFIALLCFNPKKKKWREYCCTYSFYYFNFMFTKFNNIPNFRFNSICCWYLF